MSPIVELVAMVAISFAINAAWDYFRGPFERRRIVLYMRHVALSIRRRNWGDVEMHMAAYALEETAKRIDKGNHRKMDPDE